MKNWIIKGFLLTVLLALNTGCVLHSTGSTEVGVRTQKLAFLGNQGVEQRIYSPGSTYFFIPIINDWHTFDTKLQNLEMTFASNQGDLLERDDLRFKTIDGNDISMDVIISYRIIPKMAPYILEHIARNDDELRTKIVRTVTRSRPRDIFGELETELFYTAENRSLKSESAKTVLNEILNAYGVMVERVMTKDYRFNAAYQQAIEDKKIADQKTEQNKSAGKAKEEEYKRKLQQTKGQVNKIVAIADGDYKQTVIAADAYYEQQNLGSQAIRAEAVAEAEGIRRMNQALAEKGGRIMVKLKVAEALKGKRIILLPSSGAQSMDLKSLDVNKLIDRYGLEKLKDTATTKAKSLPTN